jgi:hypothetical protein
MIQVSLVLLSCAVFLAGIYCGHRKVFPFALLISAKRRFAPDRRFCGTPTGQSPSFVVSIDNDIDLIGRRAALCNYLWGDAELPVRRVPDEISPESVADQRSFGDLATLARWRVRMLFEIDSKILVMTPRGDIRATTLIYQQGHEGDIVHGAATIRYFLRNGFRVVALAMPLLGGNSQPWVDLCRHGRFRLQHHDCFPMLDHEFGVHSVRFFVEPVIACVNQLRKVGAHSIAMLGSSGGGWTTTLCAALDERISHSFPVAGTLPFSQRRAHEMSDYENHLPELYELANYPELYVMGAFGAGRRQLQILNKFDTVAWEGDRGAHHEEVVRDTLERLGTGSFEVMLDDTWVGHGISAAALRRIREELHGLG